MEKHDYGFFNVMKLRKNASQKKKLETLKKGISGVIDEFIQKLPDVVPDMNTMELMVSEGIYSEEYVINWYPEEKTKSIKSKPYWSLVVGLKFKGTESKG